eukprot:scaffold44444_cov5024-Amphora_coffeaeformis.AAC.5
MPTGGAAIMRGGENLLYLARKEQCLALGTQLRTFKINNYKIYRIFPSGEVQYLHPKDGVFPEKVNPGRTAVNSRDFSIGKNPEAASIKFSGTTTYEIYDWFEERLEVQAIADDISSKYVPPHGILYHGIK